MSETKNDNNDSDSSELFNEEEKVKNADIISSSSEEENNPNNNNKKGDSLNNINENTKYLGNKRSASKDQKDKNDYNNDSRKKIKKYNNNYNYSNDKKNFQPSLDIPLVTFDLFCELYNEKNVDNNLSENEMKKLYDEYKLKHEQKNNEQFFNNHKNDEWFLEKYNPYKYVQFNEKERNEMCQKKAKIFFDSYDIEKAIGKKEVIDMPL